MTNEQRVINEEKVEMRRINSSEARSGSANLFLNFL